jgi:hypothetical protein
MRKRKWHVKTRVAMPALATFFWLGSPAISHAAPAQNAANQNRPADDQDTTRQELARFDQFLDAHREIGEQLRRDPSLVNKDEFVKNHPALQTFLQEHPGVREELKENPNAFMHKEARYDRYEDSRFRGELAGFDRFLDSHREVAEQVERNPSLLNDKTYLKNHPELQSYLKDHPEFQKQVRRDPYALMRAEEQDERRDGSRIREERVRFDQFLDSHREISEELHKNPSLLNDKEYLKNHPELETYLKDHPGFQEQVRNDPYALMRAEDQDKRTADNRDRDNDARRDDDRNRQDADNRNRDNDARRDDDRNREDADNHNRDSDARRDDDRNRQDADDRNRDNDRNRQDADNRNRDNDARRDADNHAGDNRDRDARSDNDRNRQADNRDRDNDARRGDRDNDARRDNDRYTRRDADDRGRDNDAHRDELASFDRFLDSHREIAEQVRKNPSLANNQEFVENHPALKSYLQQHPGVRTEINQNPNTFMQQEARYDQNEGRMRGEAGEPHRRFGEFLGGHSNIAGDLSKNPSLVKNDEYMANHPELKQYLGSHPDVQKGLMENPESFIKSSQQFTNSSASSHSTVKSPSTSTAPAPGADAKPKP